MDGRDRNRAYAERMADGAGRLRALTDPAQARNGQAGTPPGYCPASPVSRFHWTPAPAPSALAAADSPHVVPIRHGVAPDHPEPSGAWPPPHAPDPPGPGNAAGRHAAPSPPPALPPSTGPAGPRLRPSYSSTGVIHGLRGESLDPTPRSRLWITPPSRTVYGKEHAPPPLRISPPFGHTNWVDLRAAAVRFDPQTNALDGDRSRSRPIRTSPDRSRACSHSSLFPQTRRVP